VTKNARMTIGAELATTMKHGPAVATTGESKTSADKSTAGGVPEITPKQNFLWRFIMAETKTIDDLTDDYIGGTLYSSGEEEIKKLWTFGWDLESINGGMRQKTMYGQSINQGRFVNLKFVRDQSIPIISELAKLEKEYNKPNYDSAPSEPIKIKLGVGSVILSLVLGFATYLLGAFICTFLLHGLTDAIGYVLCITMGIVIIIVTIRSRLGKVKTYKKEYAVYEEKLATYNETINNFNKNRIGALEKAKSLSESDASRQSALNQGLNAWGNRPNKPRR
jgi:hypothetical protein